MKRRTETTRFLSGKAGVYCWVDKTTLEHCVGSSTVLRQRFYAYTTAGMLEKGGGEQNERKIHAAIRERGIGSFAYLLLELTDVPSKSPTPKHGMPINVSDPMQIAVADRED